MGEGDMELAMRVVNLRRALETANRQIRRCAREHGVEQPLLVGCDELATPTFREGRRFWSEVRKVAAGDEGQEAEKGQSTAPEENGDE